MISSIPPHVLRRAHRVLRRKVSEDMRSSGTLSQDAREGILVLRTDEDSVVLCWPSQANKYDGAEILGVVTLTGVRP